MKDQTVDFLTQWVTGEEKKSLSCIAESIGIVKTVDFLCKRYQMELSVLVNRLQKEGKSKIPDKKITTILIHYENLSNGGIQRVISMLLNLLYKDYRFILLTDLPSSQDDYPIPDDIVRITLPQSELKTYLQDLQKILTENDVDLFWEHAYFSQDILWSMILCKLNGIRTLLHHHNIFSNMLIRGNPEILILYSIYRLFDVQLDIANINVDVFRLLGIRSYYMQNPVSVKVPATDTPRQKKNNILWCARITDAKCPIDAIRIFALVHKKIPGATLTFVGSGDSKQEDTIRQTIRYLKLEQSVNLTGYKKDPMLFYRNADTMLVTSKFDGFMLTLMEAKAAACPIVMYDLSYLDTVQKNDGIIPVPQGDIEGAADALCRILSDDTLREQLSEEAERSYEYFASVDLRKEYLSFFEHFDENACTPAKVPLLSPERMRQIIEILLFHGKIGLETKQKQLQIIEDDYRHTANENNGLLRSAEYRIGVGICFPFRKIFGFFRCVKENGFSYSVTRALEKLHLKKKTKE